MALRITDACINCGACALECPNHAIYEGAFDWTMAEGTSHRDNQSQEPLQDDYYFIVSSKCTECVGFHDAPQCAFVCPADCCLPDPEHFETFAELEQKKKSLHND